MLMLVLQNGASGSYGTFFINKISVFQAEFQNRQMIEFDHGGNLLWLERN